VLIPVQNALLMGGYGVGQRYSELYAPDQRLTAIFIGGCTGGVLQSFLMSPVELIKVSQQCATGKTLISLPQLLSAARSAVLWRGLGATLLRDGIPHGVWFVSYEVCKDRAVPALRDGSKATSGSTQSQFFAPLVSGAFAATVAWTVGYPADLIKTRIQYKGGTILETAKEIIQEANGKGFGGLYRGFGLKLIRSVPASMIGFSTYEFVKKEALEYL
jgi:hypothetical protein